MRGGAVTLDASASSQFVSGLLLSAARFDEGVTVHHDGGAVPSLPHIEMTVETLRDAGVVVDDGDVHTWRVEPSEVNALDVQVEPDLSNAAQFLAAALVTGGRVHVPGWPQYTTQGGDFVRDVLDMMGAEVVLDRSGLTVTAGDGIGGIDVDLHDSSELTPVVAALCALAEAPERHPRRRPRPRPRDRPPRRPAHRARRAGRAWSRRPTTGCGSPRGRCAVGSFHTYADHRMVMAAAVLGLAVPGVVVEDVGTVAKTMPEFTTLWGRMLSERVVAGA